MNIPIEDNNSITNKGGSTYLTLDWEILKKIPNIEQILIDAGNGYMIPNMPIQPNRYLPHYTSPWYYVTTNANTRKITIQHNLNMSIPFQYQLYFTKFPVAIVGQTAPQGILSNITGRVKTISTGALTGVNFIDNEAPSNEAVGNGTLNSPYIANITPWGKCSGRNEGYQLSVKDSNSLLLYFNGTGTMAEVMKSDMSGSEFHTTGYVQIAIWK